MIDVSATLKYSNDALRRLLGPLGALKRKIEDETGGFFVTCLVQACECLQIFSYKLVSLFSWFLWSWYCISIQVWSFYPVD